MMNNGTLVAHILMFHQGLRDYRPFHRRCLLAFVRRDRRGNAPGSPASNVIWFAQGVDDLAQVDMEMRRPSTAAETSSYKSRSFFGEEAGEM
jgi:hypothetical protein